MRGQPDAPQPGRARPSVSIEPTLLGRVEPSDRVQSTSAFTRVQPLLEWWVSAPGHLGKSTFFGLAHAIERPGLVVLDEKIALIAQTERPAFVPPIDRVALPVRADDNDFQAALKDLL